MSYSIATYTGNGSNRDFSVTFPYLQQSHVEVRVDGVLKTVTTDYTWYNATTIRFNTAPANGAVVDIRRNSSRGTRLVDFQDASTLTAEVLDLDANQVFYICQEAFDSVGSVLAQGNAFNYDAGGRRLSNVGTPTDAADAVTKAYADSTIPASISAAAASAAAASTSASNAAASASAAATSASNAAASASAAATSASNAATSESNAAATLANAVSKTTIDAKGDLIVGTADNTVVSVPVGTEGQIIRARSSATPGIAWEDEPPINNARLSFVSATQLQATRFNGKYLTINGRHETIPSGGITISNGSLSSNTVYYIYAYMSGSTMTLEASTTAPTTDTGTGLRVKTGDNTRTLVGMARTNASAQFEMNGSTLAGVRSWRNEAPFRVYSSASGVSTSSTSYVATGATAQVLLWGGEFIWAQAVSYGYNATAGAYHQWAIDIGGDLVGLATEARTSGSYATATPSHIRGLFSEGDYVTVRGMHATSAGTLTTTMQSLNAFVLKND